MCLIHTMLFCTFRLIQSGHTAKEIINATFEASRTRKERFETIHQLKLMFKGLAMQATQKGLVLKTKQRQPAPPPTPPISRKSHQQEAMKFPNIPGRVLSPLSVQNTSITLKRRKRAGAILHPGLGPMMYGNGSMKMVPPKRVLSPPRTDYRKTPVRS
jgi:hypothetical protein